MIKIKNLKKQFDTPNEVINGLADINLSITQGEIFGVIGKSGAGKSTLLRCINRLEEPDSGTVEIAGVEMTRLDAKALRVERRKIGMIFQHFNLLSSKTVFENIALPLRFAKLPNDEIEQRVTSLLELTGLTDKRDVYPAKLSGGQKQRVAIARALANEPDVLLSDEATSALDPETTVSILRLLKDINQKLKLTIIIITHDMNVVKDICDRVAIIEQGKIVETGNVLTVFTKPQHAATRSLVRSIMHTELPDAIIKLLNINQEKDHFPLLRITYVGNSTAKPFLYSLATDLHIEFSVLQANIEFVHSEPVGIMLVAVKTDDQQLPAVLKFAGNNGLQVEVLGYVHQHHL